MDSKKIRQQLKYEFKQEELLEKAQELAEDSAELQKLEDEKKSFNSEMKSKLDMVSARISLNSRKVREKYEYRDFECEVIYNEPERVFTTWKPLVSMT
tara:strand:+ start:558 stop:851 length:294 start_codon:yes stop_codon:yes gene_type:complete